MMKLQRAENKMQVPHKNMISIVLVHLALFNELRNKKGQ